jgi:uncharacterized delta-60 repeat protein
MSNRRSRVSAGLRSQVAVAAALIWIAVLAPDALAAPGDLDPTFGGDGTVFTRISSQGNTDILEDLALQSDGKILAVAGVFGDDSQSADFGVVRYVPDGTLDPTFGSGGITSTDLTDGGADIANAVALQSDGRIVVSGLAISFGRRSSSLAAGVARYLPDGSLDSSFGRGGIVTVSLKGASLFANDVAIQPDGKIVVLGTRSVCDEDFNCTDAFAFLRFTSSGALDRSFGQRGIVITDVGSSSFATELALQSDGKLVAVGGSDGGFVLTRHNTNGSLDLTFGQGGIVTTQFPDGESFAGGVVIQPDGRIIAAGSAGGFAGVMALARYSSDGSLDSGFGSGGLVTTTIGSGAHAADVALQSDGRIVAGGTAIPPRTFPTFALARYTSAGSPDRRFGRAGIVTTDFGNDSELRSLVIQADGKILAGGCVDCASDLSGFGLARYLSS